MSETPTLHRSISRTPLIFYGSGTMVGAGFYALLGRVAGLAGMSIPIALGFSGLLAMLSAASFAGLSSRFPVSAGEGRYVEEGFRSRVLAIGVGWLVIVTGVVSAAALSVATIGFLRAMIEIPGTSALSLLVRDYGCFATRAVGVVSLLAGLNGALVQIVMASRVAYGMARRGQAPAWLGRVDARTRTPVASTALMTVITGLLAVFFPLTSLARTTSSVILVIFSLVNLSLWRIKQNDPDPYGRGLRLPAWLPLSGACSSVAALLFQGWTLLGGLG